MEDRKQLRNLITIIGMILIFISLSMYALPFIQFNFVSVRVDNITGFEIISDFFAPMKRDIYFDENDNVASKDYRDYKYIMKDGTAIGVVISFILSFLQIVVGMSVITQKSGGTDSEDKAIFYLSLLACAIALLLDLLVVKLTGYSNDRRASVGSAAIISGILTIIGGFVIQIAKIFVKDKSENNV